MLKKLARTLGLASVLLSATTQALPIVQADAFDAGDNKAALETSTGLVWMDFGVNQHQSYSEVVSLLDSDYAGWRLPTAAEVDHLWTGLFGSLPEWNRFFQGLGYLSTAAHDAYFAELFEVFGNSADATFNIEDEFGIAETWTAKSMFGVFIKEPGVSGFVRADSPYDDIHENNAMYLEMFDTDVSGWFSTMLVKNSATDVPEPSPLVLSLLAMIALVMRRRV